MYWTVILPPAIRVRISSEAAGAISMTPVVVREMPLPELIELILGTHGKDLLRIKESLARGTFVSGASRLRWEGWEPEMPALEALLRSFPDSDPRRPFDSGRCLRAVFRSGAIQVNVDREAAMKRRVLERRNFWDALMSFAVSELPEYIHYSYRERADRYRIVLKPAARVAVAKDSALLRDGALARRIRELPAESVDFDVTRS